MRFQLFARALFGAALALTSITLLGACAVAAPNDYRFELVSAQPIGPGKTAVTVRLVHLPDTKPVVGAVLFETKADMTPAGMADMAGKVSPATGDQPGLYRLQIETGMAGKWRLTLGAKAQGEAGTVRGSVSFEAK